MLRRGWKKAPHPAREFDEATADAVALMTLYVGADADSEARAGMLLEEFLAGGAERTIEGFETLCGALLVLLELETGVAPEAVLRRIGAMIATDGCLHG